MPLITTMGQLLFQLVVVQMKTVELMRLVLTEYVKTLAVFLALVVEMLFVSQLITNQNVHVPTIIVAIQMWFVNKVSFQCLRL